MGEPKHQQFSPPVRAFDTVTPRFNVKTSFAKLVRGDGFWHFRCRSVSELLAK